MKHILLGIDGTWRAAFQDTFQSNVYRMNLSLNFRDKEKNPQIFVYSSGVGTAGASSRLPGGALGEGLDAIILQAYINLVANYQSAEETGDKDDKIYIFGFSRGAFAARALSGFISYAGLLKANSSSLIEDAWRYFVGNPLRNYASLKGDNTHAGVKIEFLGVWDTVSGPYRRKHLLDRYRFRNLALDPSVKNGIHILSIDESRGHFKPIIWTHQGHADQVMEQIWMPGVHTDIGGGFSGSFISTLSLLLMLEKLAHCCPQLEFDDSYINESLLPVLETEDVIINDDWPSHWLHRALGSPRYVSDHEPKCNFSQHPLTKLMHEKPLRIRKKASQYKPFFRLHSKERHLTETSFVKRRYHPDIEQLKKKFDQ